MDVRKWINVILVGVFLSAQARGQSRGFLSNTLAEEAYKNRISEYFYNKTGAEMLRQVKLMGLVRSPGIYHVPADTNLTTLISIAGGADRGADLNEIIISNPDGKSVNIDLQEQLKNGKDIGLRPNDIVFIPEKKVTFDSNVTNGAVVITGILSLMLTSYVVFKK